MKDTNKKSDQIPSGSGRCAESAGENVSPHLTASVPRCYLAGGKMAKFRQIHTEIWDDPSFQGLGIEGKLVFIYLFSNYKVGESGLYTIIPRKISFDTGVGIDTVHKLLDGGLKNVFYDNDNNTVFVAKHRIYNKMGGEPEKIKIAILNERIKYSSKLWSIFDEIYDEYGNPLLTLNNELKDPSLVSSVKLVSLSYEYVENRIKTEFPEIKTLLTSLFTNTEIGLLATRKTRKIQATIFNGELDYYQKYDVNIVGKAIEIYLGKEYATKAKGEKYLRGIIRGLYDERESWEGAEVAD